MRDYDELEPLSDQEIDRYLGTVPDKSLGEALQAATPQQKAKARSLLEKSYEKWLGTTEELSIVARALREFDAGNFGHPAISRYLSGKANAIF